MLIIFLIEDLNSGGAQRQLVGAACGLKQRGFQVEVVYYYKNEFFLGTLKEQGVGTHFIEDAVSLPKRIMKVKAYLKKSRPDAVISFLDTPAMVAGICKMLGGKWKFIAGERNTTQKLSRKSKLKFRLYRYADLIVPNSRSQARFIEEHFPKLGPRVDVITNFVDTSRFYPNSEITKPVEEVRLISVGRISPQKNVLAFLQAVKTAAICTDIKFRVDWYGRPDKVGYMEEVNAMIERLSLSDLVRFHEPDNEIQDRYNESHWFILPSLYEGFPNVLCEAMSCGLPALAGRVCDNADILSENKGGYLFDPSNVEDMASAIVKALETQDDSRSAMGAYNRDVAFKTMGYDAFVDKYVDAIERVI